MGGYGSDNSPPSILTSRKISFLDYLIILIHLTLPLLGSTISRYFMLSCVFYYTHVEEDLVLPVLDPLASPGHGVRQRYGGPRRRLQPVPFLCDVR